MGVGQVENTYIPCFSNIFTNDEYEKCLKTTCSVKYSIIIYFQVHKFTSECLQLCCMGLEPQQRTGGLKNHEVKVLWKNFVKDRFH